jgi:hypothetical protein
VTCISIFRYPIGLLLTLYGVILAIQGGSRSERARPQRQPVLGRRDDCVRLGALTRPSKGVMP